MIQYLYAIILGIVEGFTEFLPISSTGHLILVNQFISFDKQFTLLFDIVIQLGAIIAVAVYFAKRLWPFTKDRIKNKEILNVWYKTIIGVLPAIIFGALFAGKIEEKLFNPWVVAIALLLGGLIILIIERKNLKPEITSINSLSFKTAFLIGLVQCLSMIPGTSRSAATIIGAMIFGASRIVATEFSFFLAIPTMLAASVYSLFKYKALLNTHQISVLAVGFAISFIVALAVIKFFIKYVQNNNFKIFGYYRVILAILIIAYFLAISNKLTILNTLNFLVSGFLGYIIGRWADNYLNIWLKDPAWAPHHWIYGLILMVIGIFCFKNNLEIWIFSFGLGLFISDLKDFLDLKLFEPDGKSKETIKFWHID